MMCDFKQSTERVELKIHPDKTKFLSNQSSNRRKEVEINNIKVEILPACERAKYLGQTITFQQQETAEIKNRIRAAWASLYRYKEQLTSTPYFLQHRLRLFNMVTTPTLSYASGTWTLSREHERNIRSTQRKMLRLHRPNEKKIHKGNTDQQELERRRR